MLRTTAGIGLAEKLKPPIPLWRTAAIAYAFYASQQRWE
jgi:hypothetical protein